MAENQIIIEPHSRLSLRFRELWQYRELFYFFTWRDIKVKYKQTYLGIIWALIQPLSLMLLFTFVFSKNLNFSSSPLRYEIFVLSGLILWNLFYSSVSMASESMLQHAAIIKKVFFPRLIIPVSSILAALFDFIIALIAFLIFSIVYNVFPGWTAFYSFPFAILLILVSAFGTGVFLSALNIKYRDFRYVVPFVLQFLFFATQVVYPLNKIEPDWLRYSMALNPVNGAVELFRYAYTGQFESAIVIISAASALFITFIGLLYFRKSEAYFADLS